MGLYKRGTVYWYRYTGSNGKQHFTSLKTKDKREAKKAASKIDASLFEDRWVPDKQKEVKLSELCSLWLATKAEMPSQRIAANHTRQAIAYFGDINISAITKIKMLKYIQHLENKNYAASTINGHARTIKSLWLYAEKLNYKHHKFDVYRKKQEKKREDTISQQDFERLIQAIKTPIHNDLKTVFYMSYYSAFRLSEITQLEKSDIDFEQGLVLLKAATTKTKKARYVPLHPDAVEWLKKLPDGKIINVSQTTLREWFRMYLRRLGIGGNLVIHSLRHTAITNLRRHGLDIMTISKISGHTCVKTLQRYSHHDVSDLKNIFTRDKKN